MHARTLIRGARILTMDARLGDQDPGDLLIEGSRIGAVAPRLEAGDARVIDGTGAIVLPGFVDAHRHVWQTQLRTVATDWSLFDYFVRMRCGYGTCYGPDDVYLGNLAGALEALAAGVTTVADHCHVLSSPAHADAAIDGLRDAGIRALFCYGLFASPRHGPFRWTQDPAWRLADARRVRRDRLAADDGLLLFGLAPGEVEAQPLAATAAEIRLARELGAQRISCHVAMGAYDRGLRVVHRLHEEGLLGPDVLLVHGAALTDAELDAAAATGAGVVSTPETELQMGMGHPVAFRALGHGVRAGLGVDIVSNYAGDMFAPMRLLLQAQRARDTEALAAPPRRVSRQAREVLALATIGGARALGLDGRIGSLTPGKDADVVLVRAGAINMTPVIDPVGAIVLNATVHDVEAVWVAGRVVKQDGRLVGVDWPALRDRLEASGARIRAAFARIPLEEIEAAVAPVML